MNSVCRLVSSAAVLFSLLQGADSAVPGSGAERGSTSSSPGPGNRPESRKVQQKNILDRKDIPYDFDIVYVRSPRQGDDRQTLWSDVFAPFQGEPGSDLVLLHPDGREEVLVAAGDNSVTDPAVSLDGEWVYYALLKYQSPTASGLLQSRSSDLYKIHIASKKVVPLTHQEYTPSTSVVPPDAPTPGVYNLGPCPLPGGRLVFTSTRNGLVASKNYKGFSAYESATRGDYKTSQLFILDESSGLTEQIGYMNLNGALDPVLLADGRILFSSFESQGLRDPRSWSFFTIHPDGTNWAPLVSALAAYNGTQRHFAAQRTNGRIVYELYYFQHNHGFGSLFEVDAAAPPGEPYFQPGIFEEEKGEQYEVKDKLMFVPHGLRALTPFAHSSNKAAAKLDAKDPLSPLSGKLTHPAAAPRNQLLVVWSPGPVYGIITRGLHRFAAPAIDSGLYLIPDDGEVRSPEDLVCIRNDPRYNEKFPRVVLPYEKIHGAPPVQLPAMASERAMPTNPALTPGTPFALFGSSSLYKRESYPRGVIPSGSVTSGYNGGKDLHEYLGTLAGIGGNWMAQGADTAKYSNSEIHALRILAMEPTTDPASAGRTSRLWWNMSNERYRILGEIPVRKFRNGREENDPDGNPDTSFLVKLPADVPWTVQTLDRDGMVLNMAQTWHMLRPGEVRNNCGGCHAHTQKPTLFDYTAAARADYEIFDLTKGSILITNREKDESGRQWDADHVTGVRHSAQLETVEYLRDIQPILRRSCTPCHTRESEKPAGNLVLDDDDHWIDVSQGRWLDLLMDKPPRKLPGTYMRLACDSGGEFGHPSGLTTKIAKSLWGYSQLSRYVRAMQSRRSLLAWKIFGRRLDGFRNEDFLYFAEPGNPNSLTWKGSIQPTEPELLRKEGGRLDLAYLGTEMPPKSAIEGVYVSPEGKKIQVPALSDEDRRMIVRWIDLGCPIDLSGAPAPAEYNKNATQPGQTGNVYKNNGGWYDDEIRPTVSITWLKPRNDSSPGELRVGLADAGSGLDLHSLRITCTAPLAGAIAGENLAPRFAEKNQVWSLAVTTEAAKSLSADAKPVLTVSIRDRAGNLTERQQTLR